MTIIQFIDNNPIRNLVGCKLTSEDTIIFCGRQEIIDRVLPNYKRFLEYRGANPVVKTEIINVDDFTECLCRLEEIILVDNPGCTVCVKGGSDIAIFCLGAIYDKHRANKGQFQTVDYETGEVEDVDGDGNVTKSNLPYLNVEEYIILHGGEIKSVGGNGITRDNLDEKVASSINTLWSLYKKHYTNWIRFVALLNFHRVKNVTNVPSNIIYVKGDFIGDVRADQELKAILDDLTQKRLLEYHSIGHNKYSLKFVNEPVKSCFDKVGNILELKGYISALTAKRDNKFIFDDVKTGVSVNWHDNETTEWENDITNNEIDIMATKGYDIFFISCKVGRVEFEELYKLDTVALKFGGITAKKALMATDFSYSPGSRTPQVRKSLNMLMARADRMGISVIQNVHKMGPVKFDDIYNDSEIF